jgi:hypothetical protein
MANQRNLKAFVRYDGSGRVVAGSLILRKNKPKVGRWQEIPAYECCNYVPTTTTTTTASPTTTTTSSSTSTTTSTSTSTSTTTSTSTSTTTTTTTQFTLPYTYNVSVSDVSSAEACANTNVVTVWSNTQYVDTANGTVLYTDSTGTTPLVATWAAFPGMGKLFNAGGGSGTLTNQTICT